VVDPGDGSDLRLVEEFLDARGLKLTAIVITHAHIDHIGGAAKLKARRQAPVYMNAADQVLYDHLEMQAGWLGMRTPEKTEIDSAAKDGDRLKLGATEIEVRHTPGHTPGSMCLYLEAEKTLVAGDTLFRDSIGRTDLPGGDSKQILKSIHGQLLTLPDETRVICGHGPATTIGRERALNPFL